MLLGGLIAGALAFATIVFAHEGNAKYLAAGLVGAVILIALPLIRDRRLFCLYMIVLLSGIKLRVTFLAFPHMGGAGGLFFDAVDPFLLLLLYFQVRDRIRGHPRTYRFPPACALWTGMILLGVGSVIFGYLRILAANEAFRMAKLLLLALLVVNEVTRHSQFRHVVIALALGVIVQSTAALAQFLMGAQLGLDFLGEATDEEINELSVGTLLTGEFAYRPGGLLGHSNLLAAYLALYMPMAIALILAPVSWLLKVLLAIALLVGQPALVLTLSRGGWIEFSIAFVIVLALGAVHPVSRRKFLLARVVIVAGTVAVAAALSPQILQRVVGADPNSVKGRIEWLGTATAMIMDNPMFGVGLNAYVYAQLPYGENKTPQEMTQQYGDLWPVVHNSWVLTWAEQGVFGFILWVALHISVIAVAVRNLRIRDPMMHALSAGLLAGFIAIMIDGLTSFFVRTEAPARMFWIAAALILAIGYWRRANEQSDPALADFAVDPKPPQADSDAAARGRWLPYRASGLR